MTAYLLSLVFTPHHAPYRLIISTPHSSLNTLYPFMPSHKRLYFLLLFKRSFPPICLLNFLLTFKDTSHLLKAVFSNFPNYRHSWPTLSQHVTQWIGILYVLYKPTSKVGGFPGGSVVKNPLSLQETQVWSLGQEDPLEKEMEAHSSILAWRIPWIEEPGGLQSMGLQRVGHNWSDLVYIKHKLKNCCIAWGTLLSTL